MKPKSHISASANVKLVKKAIAKNVIVKIVNAKIASAENEMPEKLSKKMKSEGKLPFDELKNGNSVIRKFSETLNSGELHWHRDREDRVVKPKHRTNWLFQRENQLPEPIIDEINIKAGEWHRIIKGSGSLEIEIIK